MATSNNRWTIDKGILLAHRRRKDRRWEISSRKMGGEGVEPITLARDHTVFGDPLRWWKLASDISGIVGRPATA